MKTLNDIRREFISFFQKNSHAHVNSSSLVPHNDPTLMFTTAGMVQFKDIFTGKEKSQTKRAVTSQKCVRAGGKHNDLDNVGYTGRHLTFFEMLGNFSFGDYFKEEAIPFAWDFVTKILLLDPKKLYVTIYHDDERSHQIWKKVTNFDDSKIIRIKTDDNFWSMGETGPCGPCSEIFFDHGDKIFGGLPGTKDQDGDRYVEIWNLVFMQYEKLITGERVDLPKQSIDTGMGLERVSAVVQGVHDNYQTDLFRSLINESEEITSKKAEGNNKFSHRVIADHLRSTSFLIADGVMPSNEGRGYVLRRIIRRAVRHIHNLGYQDILLPKLLPALVSQMSEAYPQLIKAESLITQVLSQEESSFRITLEKGLRMLESEIKNMGSSKILSGEVAFKLHDTYGFPLDLTQTILNEKKLSVDIEGFQNEMKIQKEMARKSWMGSGEKQIEKLWFDIYEEVGVTEFIGYDDVNGQGKILALIQDNKKAEYIDNSKDEFYLVTNQTPFYGESGGQLGDKGLVTTGETKIEVIDTKKPLPKLFIHKCRLNSGLIKLGDIVEMSVDFEHRNNLKANHTATHLLNSALRKKFGDHIVQKGSLVAGDRLRFDFSHNSAIPNNILREIESEINNLIVTNLKVETKIQSYNEAIDEGALAQFGEKYEPEVRVIYIGDIGDKYSIELCGGTHVKSLSEICSFQIISESAIAAGIRRIEAVTRLASFNRTQSNDQIIESIESIFRSSREDVINRLEELIQSKKYTEKELAKVKAKFAQDSVLSKENFKKHKELEYLVEFTKGLNGKELRDLVVANINHSKNRIICLISIDLDNGIASYISATSDDLSARIKANDIVNIIAKFLGSKAGGNDKLAQGGAKLSGELSNEKLEELKQNVEHYIVSLW